MFISERSNKRWIHGRPERPGNLRHQFVFFFLHTNAEDHRNPQGTRLPASREVRTLAKVFRQRVVDLLISEYAEGC